MWLVRGWLLALLGLSLSNGYQLRSPPPLTTDVIDIKQAIDLIKERTSISDIVSHYVSIKPAGAGQYQCKCPFHNDGNPSMGISDERGVYNCFSCGAKGDSIQFVKDIEQLTFIDAVKKIISLADLNVETLDMVKRSDEELRFIAQRSRLELLLKKASRFYSSRIISDNKAGIARRHLMSRKIRPEIAFKFEIGYAPLSSGGVGGLISNLTAEGFTLKEIINAGLAIDSDTFQQNVTNETPRTSDKRHAAVYDRFRDRLMIPIKNPQGAVIGFGGRTLQDLINNINYDASKVPKYLNSPETMLFKKSATLFGLDVARRAIGTERVAVFVEGYFDVISLHDIGVENAVGVLGTAITKDHLEAAARASKDGIIVLLMDSDKAGQTAVERCCTQVLSQSDLGRLDVRIASFTSLLSQNNNGLTHELVKDASDLCSLSTNRAETFALVKGVIDDAIGWKQWMAERIILRGVKPIASASIMLMNNDNDVVQATDELRRDTASLSRVLKNLSIFIASLPDRADRTLLSFYCSEKLAGNNDGLKATLDIDLSQMIEAQATKFWGAAKYDAATRTGGTESSRTPIVNRSMLPSKPRGDMGTQAVTGKAMQANPTKDYSPESTSVKSAMPPPVSRAQNVISPASSLIHTNTLKSATSVDSWSATTAFASSSSAARTNGEPLTGSTGTAAPSPVKTANPTNDEPRNENRVSATATSMTTVSSKANDGYRSGSQAKTAYPSYNTYRSNGNRVSGASTSTPSVKKISVNMTNAGGDVGTDDDIVEIDIYQLSASFQQFQSTGQSPTKRRAKYGSSAQYQDPVIWEQTTYDDSSLSLSKSRIGSRIRDAEALVLSAYCTIPSVRDFIDKYLKKENPHMWVDRMHAYIWDAICRLDMQGAEVITETLRAKLAVTSIIESIINGDIVNGKELIGVEFTVKDAIRVLSTANSCLAQSELLLELYDKSGELDLAMNKEFLLDKFTIDRIPEVNPFTASSLSEQYELERQRDRLAKKIDDVIGARMDKAREKHGDHLNEVELLFWESSDLGDDDSSDEHNSHDASAVHTPLHDPISHNKYTFDFNEEDSNHAILDEDALSEEELKLKEVYTNGYGSMSQEVGGHSGSGAVQGVTFGLDDVYEDNYNKKKPSYSKGADSSKPINAKEKKYDWRNNPQSQNQKPFSGTVHGTSRGSKRIATFTDPSKLPDVIPDGWKDLGVKEIAIFDDSPDSVW